MRADGHEGSYDSVEDLPPSSDEEIEEVEGTDGHEGSSESVEAPPPSPKGD